ncbi:RagB/SusD family nutrient uptake outer membrane protein [Chitinophaga sp. sic0106]|uniref:RagB/SusD family nutrient uptake outer membrane protein n=1 Tax=Chitinophaga sp. sic0106 TaxID=2854785 RepID=UPI001C4433F9|nr:RagB/SusD family nutrient uptake outer membrane protein [Chitinophaga sp. sic0106]MBV7532015.1 RagB/SusD family nutrient uptake outer membrane protein [Chitinophaga sp. sic0106]
MTHRYFQFLFLMTLAAGMLTGCSKDFLNRPPQDQIVDANFYQTAEQVMAGTGGLYNQVWFAYNDKASHGLGDGRGGILMSGSYQVANIRMQTTDVTPEVYSAWNAFYNVVAQSNMAINNITKFAGPAVPDNIKRYGIAEGRFMRASAYIHLVMNWGPVPVIEDNLAIMTDTSVVRNTVESVWEFIIRDLRYAEENLPSTPYQKGRITKWAAKGMLAKAYLTRAGLNQSGTRVQLDLDSAAILADDVIKNSGASLMENYEDLFLTASNNNSESLFALQWKYDGDWGTQNSVQAFLAFSPAITGFSDGWGGDIGASYDQLKLYSPNDKRRKATFMFPGDHYSYIHQSVDDPNNPGKKLIQELDVPWNYVGTERYNTRAWVKKYIVGRPEDNGGKVTQQHTEINTYMLRLADVYLVYAEAKLGNSATTTDAAALSYVNALRRRAGVGLKTSLTWDDIYIERRLELAMEGQAWYDLIRLYYYNPSKALSLLGSQDKGTYRIVPNTEKNATSWTITSDTPDFYPVTASNFQLPIPAQELSAAPSLRKPPVPYKF